MTLNRKEKQVIRALYAAKRPLSTNEVAERSDMSWNTAKKYLNRLYNKKKVRYRTKGEKKGKKEWILRT